MVFNLEESEGIKSNGIFRVELSDCYQQRSVEHGDGNVGKTIKLIIQDKKRT